MRYRFTIVTVLILAILMSGFTNGIVRRLIEPTAIHAYSGEYVNSGAFGLPFRYGRAVKTTEVVPLGMTIGVRINTDGIMVLGTGSFLGEDGLIHKPSDGILRGGDLILKANEKPITNKEALHSLVSASAGDITLLLRRDGNEFEVTLTPAIAATDGVRRIGTWVRDSTKGIGTLTYYIPETGAFGALGHGIMDVDTKMLISVRNGMIMPSHVTSIIKGTRGKPGELEGSVDTGKSLGTVLINSPSGIYGKLDPGFISTLPTQTMPTANRTQITEGPATILTNVVENKVKEFAITIESVNHTASDETKGMIIRITDPVLIEATNGIVQGMSGSPIIQNGKLVGAVTHVFVQDPTKGYGIFIETMLQQEISANEKSSIVI